MPTCSAVRATAFSVAIGKRLPMALSLAKSRLASRIVSCSSSVSRGVIVAIMDYIACNVIQSTTLSTMGSRTPHSRSLGSQLGLAHALGVRRVRFGPNLGYQKRCLEVRGTLLRWWRAMLDSGAGSGSGLAGMGSGALRTRLRLCRLFPVREHQ
jgi:hypothetical protein